MLGLIILGVLVLVFGVWAASGYNGLVDLRNRVSNAFAQIDVQLKRRHDLIPNLVETAKGYLAHERGTLEAVIQARNVAVTAGQAAAKAVNEGAASSGAMQALANAEGQLGSVLTRFFAVAESYPQLKADTTMRELMGELSGTENKVALSRQSYNDAVMKYNTQTELFPTLLIARLMGFEKASLFEITNLEEREAPKVKF